MIREKNWKLWLSLLLGLTMAFGSFSQQKTTELTDQYSNIDQDGLELLLDSAENNLMPAPDSALYLAKEGMQRSFEGRDTASFSRSLELILRSYEQLEEFDSAIYFFEVNRDLYSVFPKHLASAPAYFYQGKMYRRKGDQLRALRLYEFGIEEARNHVPSNILGKLYNGVGLIYSSIGDSLGAENYFSQSLSMRERTFDSLGIAATLVNIGNLSAKRRDFSRALKHYRQAIEVYSAIEEREGIANAAINLANSYFHLEQFDKVDSIYESSAKMLDQIGNTYSLASLNQNFGSLYASRGNFIKAEQYYSTAISQLEGINQPDLSKEIHLNLGQVYELQHLHQQANEHYRSHIFIQDTLHRNLQKTASLARQLQRRNLQFQLEKEKALAQSAQMELANRNLTIGIILGIFVLLTGFGWFFFRIRNRQKRRAFEDKVDRLIQEQEQHMFGAVIRGQEQVYSQIAQELHDNIGMLLSATNLHFSNLEEKLDTQLESFQQAKSTLLKAVKEVRSLSRDMLSGTLHHLGLVDALEELLEVVRQTGQYKVTFETDGLALVDIPPTISHSLYRCVQELISNVIRHAHASEISLAIHCEEEWLILAFEDNGIGFDPSQRGGGMGIKSLVARAKDMNGTFQINSTFGQGTKISISLPVPGSRSEWMSDNSQQETE
ncbi:MAG: sensor histidine kinase [Bacteroidota bacterium]